MNSLPDNAKPIPDFNGYMITPSGEVWSSRSSSGNWRRKTAVLDSNGYPTVSLCRSGIQTVRRIHVLILETFVGPRPHGMEACHGDGDRLNSTLANLRWDTRQQNMRDAVAHGTTTRGSRNRSAKLSDADVLEARKSHRLGESLSSLSRRFGTNPSTMHSILHGRTWKHLLQPAEEPVEP